MQTISREVCMGQLQQHQHRCLDNKDNGTTHTETTQIFGKTQILGCERNWDEISTGETQTVGQHRFWDNTDN